jgi:hypothetical protein
LVVNHLSWNFHERVLILRENEKRRPSVINPSFMKKFLPWRFYAKTSGVDVPFWWSIILRKKFFTLRWVTETPSSAVDPPA